MCKMDYLGQIKNSQGYIIYPGNSHFIGFIGDFVFCILFYFYFIEEFQTAWNVHLVAPLSIFPNEKL